MNPNPVLADLFRAHIEKLGYLDEEHRGGMGSTDMGDVSWEVPAIHPYVRIVGDDVAGHSREFAQASISDEGRRAMLASAKALASTAIDVWTMPGEYERVVQVYRDRKR
jgi:metal-dependent amidase/aminoacylase/carboxypeptidase family protein